MAGFLLAQHNMWTVNSVTDMWGVKKRFISSAQNKDVWLCSLVGGNHHADHHNYPKDFRKGLGCSGWLLDPTRLAILALRATGLVKGLDRASRRQEAQIIARHKVGDSQAKARSAI